MAIASASPVHVQLPSPVCPPQESISKVAGVDEQTRPNTATIESRNKHWRAVQAAGVAVARDIDREVRVRNYEGRQKVYGPIDAPYLLGPEPLSLARYVRAPEVRDWIISQKNSDAMMLLQDLELQQGIDGDNGDGANAVVMNLVRRYEAEQPHGFRYWQRVKNVIWKPFVGLLVAREQNLKARRGEEEKLVRRNRRAEKEKVRLATRRDPLAAQERKEAAVKQLRAQAAKLCTAAKKKEARAREWFAEANRLSAAAEQKEAKAAAIGQELSDRGDHHVERAVCELGQGGCYVLV